MPVANNEPTATPDLVSSNAVSSAWRTFSPAELTGDVLVRKLSSAANQGDLALAGERLVNRLLW